MKILKRIGIGLGAMLVITIVGVLITQRVSDGPMEFLQGGPFRTGEVIDAEISDWSFAEGKHTEFELVGYGTSRTAGFVMHEGKAYMTCDLGFMWSRLEPGIGKSLLHLIYLFKHWHTDAVEDGRVRLRVDHDKIYNTQFVKVENPELIAALKLEIEAKAKEYFGRDMGPAPLTPPNDIWFFRMDPR